MRYKIKLHLNDSKSAVFNSLILAAAASAQQTITRQIHHDYDYVMIN